MGPNHLQRAGLYGLVCLASLAMWMGEESPAPYPWLVILCAIAAHAFTDHWDVLVIPARLAPLLGLGAAGLFLWEESRSLQLDPVMPLGHLVVYLQVIIFFHRKKRSYYWGMMFMSFLQIVIAAVHDSQPIFGLLLAAYVVLGLWVLTQFIMLREAQGSSNGLTTARGDGRLGRALVDAVLSGVPVLLLGILLFLLIPRTGREPWSPMQYGPTQLLSGFDQQIELGQLGTILESDDEVMRVHPTDQSDRPYRPLSEPLWRGVALTHYENGRWRRYAAVWPHELPRTGEQDRSQRGIRQEIVLQPFQRGILFCMRPVLSGQAHSGQSLRLARRDGTLLPPQFLPPGPLRYTVISSVDSTQPQAFEHTADWMLKNRNRMLIRVPDELRNALRDYSNTVLGPGLRPDEETCQLLVQHLRDSETFLYTLEESVVDPRLDPVLDFLVNRKAGHCEYFASALALMLRSQGVPARVINGFKGGDWNELMGNFYVVRQKHAHSWVEAIISTPKPHWVTLDPTPSLARQEIVDLVDATPAFLRQMRDITQELWFSYVLHYDAGEQQSVIYGSIRQLIISQFYGFFPTAQQIWITPEGSFNSWGAFIAFGSLIGGGLTLTVLVRLLGRWRTRRRRKRPRSGRPRWGLRRWVATWLGQLLPWSRLTHGLLRNHIAFYEKLLRMLESQGMRKLPGWTPRQFAQRAGIALRERATPPEVAGIPAALVDRFYQVRFGHRELSALELERVGDMLRTLKQALSDKKRK